MTLFGGLESEVGKPVPLSRLLRVIVTVKASPTPSEKSGETVCVAGLELDGWRKRWVRLYPINFRHLEQDLTFRKYDIVEMQAKPAASDPRVESWIPNMQTMTVVDHLKPWKPRRAHLDDVVEGSMCALNRQNQHGSTGQSLALVKPARVYRFELTDHPGWTADQKRKIDQYTNQLDLLAPDTDKSPLEPPRFHGHYHWKCHEPSCTGHRQSLIDWEFTALQRRLRLDSAEVARAALHRRFYDEMFSRGREVAFYVGNQAKRHHVFHVLGLYYPA